MRGVRHSLPAALPPVALALALPGPAFAQGSVMVFCRPIR